MPVQDRSVSEWLHAMMNDVGGGRLNEVMNDADVGLDVSFIAQNDIIERLVSVENLGIRLAE